MSELRRRIEHKRGQWFVLNDPKDSRKGVTEIQVPDRDWRYGEQFIGQWDAYDEVLDLLDNMTCANCRHGVAGSIGLVCEQNGQYRSPSFYCADYESTQQEDK